MTRTLWIVIGALLTLLGAAGVAISQGWLGVTDRPVLSADQVQRWNSWGAWATWGTIAVGLILAVLGFLLLRSQLRGRGGAVMPDLNVRPPASTVEDEATRRRGRTRVATPALYHALQRDLKTDRYINSASVRITGNAKEPRLRVRLAVTPDAELARVRRHVDASLDRFTVTSGLRPELAEVVVKT